MPNISTPATLTEQIRNAERLEISYRVLHQPAYIFNNQTESTIEIPIASITNKYKHYLLETCVKIQLTEREKEKYKYNPKALSMDLYGTVELWSDLLKLNKCVSIIEFEPDFITIYNPNIFKEYLNEIMIFDNDVSY